MKNLGAELNALAQAAREFQIPQDLKSFFKEVAREGKTSVELYFSEGKLTTNSYYRSKVFTIGDINIPVAFGKMGITAYKAPSTVNKYIFDWGDSSVTYKSLDQGPNSTVRIGYSDGLSPCTHSFLDNVILTKGSC